MDINAVSQKAEEYRNLSVSEIFGIAVAFRFMLEAAGVSPGILDGVELSVSAEVTSSLGKQKSMNEIVENANSGA